MFWRVFVLCVTGCLDLVLLYRLVWGPTGMLEYADLKEEHAEATRQLSKVDTKNLVLSREIRLLRTDDKYVEKMVRQRLHYLRGNEILYLFGDAASITPGVSLNDRKN